MNLPRLSGDGRQASLGRTAHVLVLTSGLLLGYTLLTVSGCAPLGIYSLAHNLASHHVLKPVVTEEPMPETAIHEEQVSRQDVSSRTSAEPIDSSRRGHP